MLPLLSLMEPKNTPKLASEACPRDQRPPPPGYSPRDAPPPGASRRGGADFRQRRYAPAGPGPNRMGNLLSAR